MAGVRVQSVAAGWSHSLTCSCDGRVYSWGKNKRGQLGHGDRLTRPSPVLVEGLEGVCSIAAATDHCLAVTHSGAVFSWGSAYQDEAENQLRPSIVEGFEGVRVRRVCDSEIIYFAIGEAGELFSWGRGAVGILGHGDIKDQASPKRVEALRGVPIDSVVCGWQHALALAEDGLMYAWGAIQQGALLCSPHVGSELLPKPVLALPGVRMSSIAAASFRSYAVADSGEVWAWGRNRAGSTPLGHDEQQDCCPFPKPVESLPGVKVDAVAASRNHTLVLADDGSTYAWGNSDAQGSGALGLGLSVSGGQDPVPTPRHIRALRVACGL
jgi:E3 ubiquitin-protein ligase HERC1